jgi:hypothetical protein
MSKPTVEELAAFIKRNISYDASVSVEGLKCPHCGKMAREEELRRWIDHEDVLVGDICRFLRLKVYEQVKDVLYGMYVDEDDNENCQRIAKAVIDRVYAPE